MSGRRIEIRARLQSGPDKAPAFILANSLGEPEEFLLGDLLHLDASQAAVEPLGLGDLEDRLFSNENALKQKTHWEGIGKAVLANVGLFTGRKGSGKQVRKPVRKPAPLSLRTASPGVSWWLFRGYVVRVDSTYPLDDAEAKLLVTHHVLEQDRSFKRIQREVALFEKLGDGTESGRAPIPEEVRLFVWRRDQGRCVTCGSRERLEFDHIIPVAEGGSSTERNIQLLCEPCNRSKGKRI